MSTNAPSLAMVKKDTVDVVAEKVRSFQKSGEIHFPAHYSPENAMKSAWLTLQSTKDRNQKPVLEVCSRDSIANSLLKMVVQGLNPAKEQGYFIAYGNQLVFQRSYFGTMAVCKRVTGAKDIVAAVVYEGDQFEFTVHNGRYQITKHTQTLDSIGGTILAAYCIVEFDDKPPYVGLMTKAEIDKAWGMSQMKTNRTRDDFPQEMAKKTVINRTCKALINSSDDESLLINTFHETDMDVAAAEAQDRVTEGANKEPLAFEPDQNPAEEPVEEAEWSEPEVAQEPLVEDDNKKQDTWGDDAPPF